MDTQLDTRKSIALSKTEAANCNSNWYKKRRENYILNNSDVMNARGIYMQKYQEIIDAAYFHCDSNEMEFLYKRYEAETDKEREAAVRLAIRILTRAIDNTAEA